jgi:hypothetical protein
MERDLTLAFLSLARKLYREEITVQAYTLLSSYLDTNRGPMRDKLEFMTTSAACLDIMSYVFSMRPEQPRGAPQDRPEDARHLRGRRL